MQPSLLLGKDTHRDLAALLKKEGDLTISGASNETAKAMLTSHLLGFNPQSSFLVTQNDEGAESLRHWLQFFDCHAELFHPVEDAEGHIQPEHMQRFLIAMKPEPGHPKIFVMSRATWDGEFPSMEELEETTVTLKVGSKIDFTAFFETLIARGYSHGDDLYLAPGEYRRIGDVLDIFPIQSPCPYRITFDFETVEKISAVDSDDLSKVTDAGTSIAISPAMYTRRSPIHGQFPEGMLLILDDQDELGPSLRSGGQSLKIPILDFTSFPEHARHHAHLRYLSVLTLGIFLASHELRRLPDGKLHVYFLNVGQGDGALIVTPSGKQIIIDGGPAEGSMIAELNKHMPFFDRTIDMLILTHPQLDHIYAFPDILRRYRVERILMTGVRYKLPRYDEFLQRIQEQRIPIWIADPSKDIDLGDGIVLDVAWPPPTLLGKEQKDVNNASIMLRVLSASGSVFFTGDGEEKEERAVLASGAGIRATVLKAGHHGSKTSSGTGFLLAVDPSLAAISADGGAKYGHPHKVILDRFRTLGIPVRVTGLEGTIEVSY